MSLLEIKDLSVRFKIEGGNVYAVNHVSLSVDEGETFGLVGETGAGKTTTALGILNLVPDPPGVIDNGEILFDGRDVFKMSKKELQAMRGTDISMIFQDPMTALNPVYTVEDQIAEVVRAHSKMDKKESLEEAHRILQKVGIMPERGSEYPHQFSGGMKQRVVIAIALSCNPRLIIADEPTSALDVTIQAQVLQMIKDLQTEMKTAMILITHDLGVVAETCDKVAVMYAGEIVEYGTTKQVFDNKLHPYTQGLFDSLPSLDKDVKRLKLIKGLMPDPTNLPEGCSFCTRCPLADEQCNETSPELTDAGDGHWIRCWKWMEKQAKEATSDDENA